MAQQSTSPFLRLPAELRDTVYNMMANEDIRSTKAMIITPTSLPYRTQNSFHLVSHQLSNEYSCALLRVPKDPLWDITWSITDFNCQPVMNLFHAQCESALAQGIAVNRWGCTMDIKFRFTRSCEVDKMLAWMRFTEKHDVNYIAAPWRCAMPSSIHIYTAINDKDFRPLRDFFLHQRGFRASRKACVDELRKPNKLVFRMAFSEWQMEHILALCALINKERLKPRSRPLLCPA